MDVLKGLRLLGELLLEPLNRRCLVRDKKIELEYLLNRHALLVILGRLVR